MNKTSNCSLFADYFFCQLLGLANNELFIRSVYNVVTRYQSQGSSIEKKKAFGSIGRRDVAKVEKKIGFASSFAYKTCSFLKSFFYLTLL